MSHDRGTQGFPTSQYSNSQAANMPPGQSSNASNASNAGSEVLLGTLSLTQIDQLQAQIRRYKALGSRLSESQVIKVPVEPNAVRQLLANDIAHFESAYKVRMQAAAAAAAIQPKAQPPSSSSGAGTTANTVPKKSDKDKDKSGSKKAAAKNKAASSTGAAPPTKSETSAPPEKGPPQPALSWQCFYSLLLSGPAKDPSADGMVSVPSADVGSFSKSAHLPLVLTAPYASTLREKALLSMLDRRKVTTLAKSSSSSWMPPSTIDSDELLALQRRTRAALVKNYVECAEEYSTVDKKKAEVIPTLGKEPSAAYELHPAQQHGPGNVFSELLSHKRFYRVKKQTRKDVKAYEREERKRRQDIEDKRKKRYGEYLKAVVSHRDEFYKFHRLKKIECGKAARAVRDYQEFLESKRKRDEARAEQRRLQALKENDMEAYAKLVQETKNDRLHYLIAQTDGYMAKINEMIQSQRSADPNYQGGGQDNMYVNENLVSPSSSSNKEMITQGTMTNSSKAYFDNTHKYMERIQQPPMLKGGDLKEYQLGGLQWMVSLYNNNINGILADEMGLGKTIQTIALIAYLVDFKKNNGPFMIVVPLSTLSNWVNETGKWAPDLIKVVYKGAPNERRQIYKDEVEPGAFNLLLTTYEYIMKDKASLKKHYWQYIIVDEGHRMKNANSKFAQTLGTIYQSRNRILLTGTPLQNNLPELWALLNFLLPSIFSSVDTFDTWFNKPFASFKNSASATTATNPDGEEVVNLTQEERMLIVHKLHELLRPFMLRRVKDQVLDQLPDKVEKVLRCSLSGWQRKMYNAVHNRSVISQISKDSGMGLNNTIMQLRKVCNHPYLFLSEWYMDEDIIRASGKFELLDRMLPKLKAAGHRVLMFSQMTQVMTILERFFEMRGWKHLRLDGSTTSEEREKRMFMFNDPDSPYFLFLLSTRAGGLGLNLATADTVILFDSDWNPMMDAQAQDRAHRIGQKNEVRVFRLITASPVEERILARATDKKNLTGLVVEAGKFNRNAAADDAEREEMMDTLLKELSGDKEKGEGGGGGGEDEDDDEIPNDDQINEMMATSAGDLELYQLMDKQREETRRENWAKVYPSADASAMPSKLMKSTELPMWLQDHMWASKNGVMKDIATATAAPGELLDMQTQKGLSGIDLESYGYVPDGVGEVEGVDIGGKTMRKRKEVVYDDGLTEKQFSRMMDKHAKDEEDEQRKSKVQRQSVGSSSGAGSGAPGGMGGSLGTGGFAGLMQAAAAPAPEEMNEFAAEDGGGGPPGGAGAAGEGSLAFQVPTRAPRSRKSEGGSSKKGSTGGSKRKSLAAESNMTQEETASFAKILADIQKIKRFDGSLYAELFKQKPDKVIYPDYYRIIAEPISYKEIAAKLKKGQYRDAADLEADMALMSHNARTFNMDTSPVFHDCEYLRKSFYEHAAASGLVHASLGEQMPHLPDMSSGSHLPLSYPAGYAEGPARNSHSALSRTSSTSSLANSDFGTPDTAGRGGGGGGGAAASGRGASARSGGSRAKSGSKRGGGNGGLTLKMSSFGNGGAIAEEGEGDVEDGEVEEGDAGSAQSGPSVESRKTSGSGLSLTLTIPKKMQKLS